MTDTPGMLERFKLDGQVAVVTGAAQGIGQGIAVRLAREGMRVVIADKNEDLLASTAAELRQLGATVLEFLGDLRLGRNVHHLRRAALHPIGQLIGSDAGGEFGGLDTPEFTALNPNRRVPVLQDGKTVVWESNAIIRYLAAKYGEGTLWNPDPIARWA